MSKKVVIVTGASSGIGLSVAVKFATEGFTTYAILRDTHKGGDLMKAAGAHSSNIILEQGNVENPNFGEVIAGIAKKAGRIDVLVNNAGIGYYGAVEKFNEEDFHKQFNVNLYGVIRGIQGALPTFREQKFGRIVQISSILGVVAFPFNSLYAASKFALEGLSQGLHQELAPFGIQVALIEPGFTRTQFGASFASADLWGHRQLHPDPYAETEKKSRSFIDMMLEKGAPPEDIAKLAFEAATATHPNFRYHLPSETEMISKILKDPHGLGVPQQH